MPPAPTVTGMGSAMWACIQRDGSTPPGGRAGGQSGHGREALPAGWVPNTVDGARQHDTGGCRQTHRLLRAALTIGDPGQKLLRSQAEQDVPPLGSSKATPAAHLLGEAQQARQHARAISKQRRGMPTGVPGLGGLGLRSSTFCKSAHRQLMASARQTLSAGQHPLQVDTSCKAPPSAGIPA